jgi:hypothetical protein
MRWLALLAVVWPCVSTAAGAQPAAGSEDSGELWIPLARNTTLTLGFSRGEMVAQNRRLLPSGERLSGFNLWVGAALHPRPDVVSPFMAAGVELGSVTPSGGGFSETGIEFIPSMRLGIALIGSLGGATLPVLQVYGIAGYRLVTRYRASAPRVGAGVSVPGFAYVQAKIFESIIGFPLPIIPWMAEVTYDMSSRREIGIRFGYHI